MIGQQKYSSTKNVHVQSLNPCLALLEFQILCLIVSIFLLLVNMAIEQICYLLLNVTFRLNHYLLYYSKNQITFTRFNSMANYIFQEVLR